MPVQLGSAHGKITISAEGVKRGVDQAKEALGGLSKQFGGMGKDIGQTAFFIGKSAGFIGAEIKALQKVFAFGKEANQLDFVRSKFDNLAVSINTTSQALLKDLQKATRGLVADSELVSSATDFMTLGLAKSHDEVVRLTRVAGALGMNMNQLVLTLTNQTTMRFDALGVAVDGFDGKVKKLVASGMSAQDAFTEAFLQQAEDQIAKVGDVADSSVAGFMRLEAAATNLGDIVKTALAPPLATAAEAAATLLSYSRQLDEAFDEHRQNVQKTAKSYDEYVFELIRAASAAGQFEGNQKRIAKAIIEGQLTGEHYTQRVNELALALGLLTEQEFNWQRAAEAGTIKVQQYASATRQAGEDAGFTAAQLAEMEKSAGRSSKELDNLVKKQDSLKQSMDRWMNETAGQVVNMLGQKFPESSEKFRAALAEVDEILGTNHLQQLEQKESVQKLVDEYAKTGNLDAFRQGLIAIREEGLATMKQELQDVTEKAGELYAKLLALPEEIRVAIKFDVDNLPSWLEGAAAAGRVQRNKATNYQDTGTTPTARAIGGPVRKNKPYRWQEGLGGELLVSERSGYILNANQVQQMLRQGSGGGAQLEHLAGMVEQIAKRPTVQVLIPNAQVRSDEDLEALAWRASDLVLERMGG
ncbi:hypothetical protein SY88_23650 [Clostridiales bacterium PH28_bin88]|nr:hypothetical protein SY88_23650 [Clostridiales bacterium PH28_bin88]